MVYILPKNNTRPDHTYAKEYNRILKARRTTPDSSIVMLVPPDLDALCAAHILTTLFGRDDANLRTIPVSGFKNLQDVKDSLLEEKDQLRTIILLNIGALLDIGGDEWFEEFPSRVTIHIIDSSRPVDLHNLFGGAGATEESTAGPRVVVWDDGHADKLTKERLAFDAEEFGFDSSSDEEIEDEDEDEATDDEALDYEEDEDGSKKRRRLAILGLTHQYLSAAITRDQYEAYYTIFSNEVGRLNPPVTMASKGFGDEAGVQPSVELRFPLLRRWNLYEAMFHSGYVANKLAIWQETGISKLNRLLTKMGLSQKQAQQSFMYMNSELRESLPDQLDNIGAESGLIELSYPSFTKSYGNEMQRTSAADVLAGAGALLEAAKGVRLTVEVEGGRGGGELFGGERIWDLRKETGRAKGSVPQRNGDHGSSGSGQASRPGNGSLEGGDAEDNEVTDEQMIDGQPVSVHNFWTAFDALGSNTSLLRQSLALAISLQKAIVRQGCEILGKKRIQFFPDFRFIKIIEGPDLATFAHPMTLTRLVLWLIEATRDRIPLVHAQRLGGGKGASRKSYPYVIACHNPSKRAYTVVGVTGAPEIGEIRRNHFTVAFLRARDQSRARTRLGTFQTSVVEVNQDDLAEFIDALADADSDDDN
ncbi:hypothetical protein M407DRAFT_21261 [Tulasnella calospora MUT 4182]|uniref:CDC45-like protein n=1 Tax=Tulasnella calospora MUT 4182 TaxID=1051891 RepID=A0A0C3QNL2_9AGAM|nr:hypothetical protein M407DRAFT_21261 [Tulasnella calospora MUT 4182]